MTHANVGENVTMKMTGITENDLCKGYVLCAAVEEAEITKSNESMITSTKKKEKNPKFVREGTVLWCVITLARSVTVDAFTGCQQMGRFTLRDEGKTIAIGKIIELPKTEEQKEKEKKDGK